MKMIVKGDCKVGNKTRGPKIPDILQIPDISYGSIADYRICIIKIECAEECIGVNNNTQATDNNYGKRLNIRRFQN